jgi:DNA-binding winged helix-turn-helix (wHTH) protein/tetratricopeptide (TPR) repeat protein
MSLPTNPIYEFGPFRLEVNERRLLRDGHPVRLKAKVFDTLRVLVEQQGRLMGKEDLMKAIWPDAIVEDNNLDHNISTLRKALGGNVGGQQYIETVPKQGYRFVPPVKSISQSADSVVASGEQRRWDGMAELIASHDQSIKLWETQVAEARLALASAETTGLEPVSERFRHHVGREQELGELCSAFERAFAGHGSLLCFAGESGIGKTALIERFCAQLRNQRHSCTIATGGCLERLSGSEALLPILEALESLFAGRRGQEIQQLMKLTAPTWYVQVAPLWATAAPSFAQVLADAKAASGERLKRELCIFLAELSNIRPLILFFDDIHWADASTVELLAYLAKKLPSMRVLVVVAYRPTEMWLGRHPFPAVRQELQRHSVCRELSVGVLSREEVDSYLTVQLPEAPVAPGIAEFIYNRTEGNPLFMVHLVSHLRCGQALTLVSGRWELARRPADLERELPVSVHSMIQRRIDQLGDEDRELLAAASVQGQEFDSTLVAEALGKDPAACERPLQALGDAQFFVRLLQAKELPDSTVSLRCVFTHGLYQNALYETLTPHQRISLSRKLAEALLSHYGPKAPLVAAEIGRLFEAARDCERAADHFLLAAQNTSRLFANEEAVLLSARALANAEKLRGAPQDLRVAAAALQLGHLQFALARFEEAIRNFVLAETAAARVGGIESEVTAICGKAGALFSLRRLGEMQTEVSRALELARQSHSEVGVAAAETMLALERMQAGDLTAAGQALDDAIPALEKASPSLAALDAISFRGFLHAWRLEYDGAEKRTASAVGQARELGTCYHLVGNLFVRGMALGNHGDLGLALATFQDGLRLAELNGERFYFPRMINTLAWVYREIQDFDASLRLDREGVNLAQEMEAPDGEIHARLNLATTHLLLGEPAKAFDQMERAAEVLSQGQLFHWRQVLRLEEVRAAYWIARGNLKGAEAHATAALDQAQATLSRKHMAWAHKLLGDIAALEERLADAQREYEAALSVLQHHRCPTIEWKILLAVATAHSSRDASLAEHYRERCQALIGSLADSITDKPLCQVFLGSEVVRSLFSGPRRSLIR